MSICAHAPQVAGVILRDCSDSPMGRTPTKHSHGKFQILYNFHFHHMKVVCLFLFFAYYLMDEDVMQVHFQSCSLMFGKCLIGLGVYV